MSATPLPVLSDMAKQFPLVLAIGGDGRRRQHVRPVPNAIKQAQAASGVNKVHAVIGGFHLAPYREDYVRETIASLKGIDIDYVIPLHCSGEPFYEMAKAEMPSKLLRS